MIEGIDDQRNEFAQVTAAVIWLREKLRPLVDQVGCQQGVENAFLPGFIKLVQPVRKQTECRADEDPSGSEGFQFLRDLKDSIAGRDHIIQKDNILSLHRRAKEFMGNDGILSVHRYRIVPSPVEHPHVYPQHVCHIDGTGGTGLVRADDHQMVRRYREVRRRAEKTFDKLVNRQEVFKSGQRDRILDAGVMGIKGDDIIDSHAYQLFQSLGTVKGFPAGTPELAAFIEKRHYHVDAACFPADRRDHPLQVDEVIIRRHVIDLSAHIVSNAVITYIQNEKDI